MELQIRIASPVEPVAMLGKINALTIAQMATMPIRSVWSACPVTRAARHASAMASAVNAYPTGCSTRRTNALWRAVKAALIVCYSSCCWLSCLINLFNWCVCFFHAAEYFSQAESKCVACHDSCETCNGPLASNCLSCTQNRLLEQSSCVTGCQDGYFMETGVCTPCLHTCTQCVSRTNCSNCSKGLELQNGECRTTCADG